MPMLTACKAYDGHMNLILSDVEETIMVVDVPEGVPESQGTVKVSRVVSFAALCLTQYRSPKGALRCYLCVVMV